MTIFLEPFEAAAQKVSLKEEVIHRCSHSVKSVRIRSISPFSIRMRENADQNISEFKHFLRCVSMVYEKAVKKYLTKILRKHLTTIDFLIGQQFIKRDYPAHKF